jgi:surface protein
MADYLYVYNGKRIAPSSGKVLGVKEDPYNPLRLPPLTVRAKWAPDYTPTIGATNTVVDATENIWDSTMSSGNWRNKFYSYAGRTSLLEVIGANTSGVTDMRQCFQNCTKLTSVGPMDLSGCTQYGPISLFYGCSKLASVGKLKTTGIPSTYRMFSGCALLTSISLFDMSSVTNASGMFYNCKALSSVPFFDTGAVTNFGSSAATSMFSGCTSLATFPAFNVSSATSLAYMFYGCSALTTVPSNWDVSTIQNFSSLFFYCYSLVNVPTLNTSSATNMAGMFGACHSLVTAPTLTTTSVTNMNTMFWGCSALKNVPLYSTSSVTSMEATFAACSSLESLPLFDTSHVKRFFNGTRVAGLCTNCTSLKSIPLLDTSSATNVYSMFNGCTAVESGALALYQQMSTQTTPPTTYTYCFTNCGSGTTTGAAELAQIPTSWGGTMA